MREPSDLRIYGGALCKPEIMGLHLRKTTINGYGGGGYDREDVQEVMQALLSSPPVQLSSIIDDAFRWVGGVGDDVPQLPNSLKVFQESVRENVVGWYSTEVLFIFRGLRFFIPA